MPHPEFPSDGIVTYGDYHSLAALGMAHGVQHIHKFGFNEEVDTAAAEDIIGGGGDYAGQPADTTPEIIEILHPNAADNSTGTGMRTVRLIGLRTPTATEYTSEDITLTGTATDSANTWWRIISIRGLTFGTGGTNAGTITARSKTTTAEIFGVVQVGVGRSQVSVFTAPYGGKTAIKDFRVAIVRPAAGTGNATVEIKVRESGGGGYTSRQNYVLTTAFNILDFNNTPFVINSGDDLIVRVTNVSANDTTVSCSFDCFSLNADFFPA